MLGTINKNGIREDERSYAYSPERPVPSFDARLGREQDLYSLYASSSVVTQRPTPRRQPQPYTPEPANREELWQRLNTNNVNHGSLEANMNFTPGQHAPYEPMKLRESQPRQQVQRRSSKKLSTQGKVILAVYLAVVLLIVTLVIVNAELINKAPEVEAPAANVNLYEVNNEGLSFMASPYNNVAEQTNWFDKLCDKIGK